MGTTSLVVRKACDALQVLLYSWFCFSHPKPPIFFSCFCFSHPKHRNPIELKWNRIQSVGPVFLPYKLVSMLNMLKSKFLIWCKDYLTHRLSMLKSKFSIRCKNCLQHRPIRTNDTPRTSSDEERVETAAKIEFLPSTPLVKPHFSSFGSKTKPMESELTPVKATQARSMRSSTMKNKKRPNSETEMTSLKQVKKKDPEEKVVKIGQGWGIYIS